MASIISFTKLQKEIDNLENVCSNIYSDMLLSGNLLEFESKLMEGLLTLYNTICGVCLEQAANDLSEFVVSKSKELGFSKLQEREVGIKLSTGFEVKISSWYGCKVGSDYSGSRYYLLRYWGVLDKCSPSYYDKVSMCSIISPSYSVGRELLNKVNIDNTMSNTRDLMNTLGLFCSDKEEYLSLDVNENVNGKRVVISLDGGRTRTRTDDGEVNNAGNKCYETNWCEPKLFVIDILDENGKVDVKEKPIYGCRFDEKEVLDLLSRYLVLLKINEAKSIQIIADGAPWIWLKVKSLLLELGVEETQIVETLDYCHAISYVHTLVRAMPRHKNGNIKGINKDEKAALTLAKQQIWQGNTEQFIQWAKPLFKRPEKEIKQAFNYLDKHKNRMQYIKYQEDKLLCGSGIVESAIRRIVNLRFKNPSTFWNKKIVERLYLFRAILVAKRWNTFIQNLVKAQA